MYEERSLGKWQFKYANIEKCYYMSYKDVVEAGWYDWFCSNESLFPRLKKMAKIVLKLENSKRINKEHMYVWFKNNCPVVGPLYDDFRLADRATGDTLYTIAIDDKRNDAKYVVWGKENDFQTPLGQFNDSRKLVAWFNEK